MLSVLSIRSSHCIATVVLTSLWGEGASVIVISRPGIPLWGASLLDLVHGAHDCLIDFVSNLLHLSLAVKGASDSLISLDELLKFCRKLEVLLVQESDVSLEGLDFVLEFVLIIDLSPIDVLELINFSL